MVYLTKKERELFTDRKRELGALSNATRLLEKGFPKNYSLVGLRKIGKTWLIRKFGSGKKVILFNVEDNFSPPEDFALRFVYSVLYTLNPVGDYQPTLANLNKILPDNKTSKDILSLFLMEYEKKNPDRILLIHKAFELPDKLAREENISLVIVLDEFQAILGLNKYPEIEAILGLIRNHFEHAERVMWLISGSAISLMLNITSDSGSPFFELFENISLDFFGRDASFSLINKIERVYNARIDTEIKKQIFHFTRGHPFYLQCITDKLLSISDRPSRGDLTKAVFEEILTPNARIYSHCRYVFDTSIGRAKGKATLKRVLEELARGEELSISEIAKEARMSIQTVNVSIIRLMEVDLIEKIDKRFRICDPVVKFWIKNSILGGGDFVKIKEARMKQLQEDLLKAKTELGIAKEFEFKVKLEEKLKIKLKNYREEDIEFDLIGKKNKVNYVFEIKWRNKPSSYKDLKNFLEKVKGSEFSEKPKKLFFVSKAGFTKNALKLAREKGILLLDEKLKSLPLSH